METTADAARLTGVSERTIRRWITAGRLTSRRRGRVWLVDPLEVSELAELRGARRQLPRKDRQV
jgi:excisionase family DNA binding protein